MRLTVLRNIYRTIGLLLAILILQTATAASFGRAGHAQSSRVDPVQALIARQASERADVLAAVMAEALATEPGAEAIQAAAAQADKFVRVTDEVESMTIDVPIDWTDIDTEPWIYQGEQVGYYMAASPDLGKFNSDLSAPGVFFGVSTTLLRRFTEDEILNLEETRIKGIDKECRKRSKILYKDQFYGGNYYPYDRCRKQAGSFYYTHVSTPPNQAYVIVLRINFPHGAHPKALERIFSSYQVLGQPGIDAHHE